jgi:hypothetical protein
MNDLVMEQAVACLRHGSEEARVGVETEVEEERHGGAEGPCETGFERRMGGTVYKEAGAA